MKAVALFSRRKTSRPFKDYHTEWIKTLETTLLPLLRNSMSASTSSPALLSIHVETLHHHFQLYYQALDLAASNDVVQLLYPEWRNSLEKPFLWLGDFHPNLFTKLLRSFLCDDEEEEEENEEKKFHFRDKSWEIAAAWKNPCKALMSRIEQIECGLRLMVPAIVARARVAQVGFTERVTTEWGRKEGAKPTAVVREAAEAQIEELTCIFLDANRLRRSILTEIIGATTVYQAALFLEGLSQFVIGFRDSDLLDEFEQMAL